MSNRLWNAAVGCLAIAIVTADAAWGGASALFTETFDRETPLVGTDRQAQTFLPVKHAHRLPGWVKEGEDMPVHFVEQYPGNWALMLVANRAEQNIFMQRETMKVNEKGHSYTVSFDMGPAVYAGLSQKTAADDQFAIELLRPDGSALARHVITPGSWKRKLSLTNQMFSYEGDGTGPLRFRILPVYTSGVRFYGTLDQLEIFDSADAAKSALAARLAIEEPARKRTDESLESVRKSVPYPSLTPQFTFSETLDEQESQLKTNELMLRFAKSRERLAADRIRPLYHFVSPESQMNDPNGLCFWQGKWHMFYQAYPADEFPSPEDIAKRRQHWGHAFSDDLVHWRDLPYAIYPGIEKMCFSGSTAAEQDRVVAYYPGIAAGQMVAISKDPLLLNWKKLDDCPVNSPSGDACIWKEGDTYFGLVGTRTLATSKDLVNWEVRTSQFVQNGDQFIGTGNADAGACPNLVPIGNKHILLSFSHMLGGQYLLGDYNREHLSFVPYERGRFNHGRVSPGGVHAPSACSDGKGGVVNILNINDGMHSDDWDQIMSVAQQLTLGPDSKLRIEPVNAIASLRGRHVHLESTPLLANKEIVLQEVSGNSMELELEIDPQMSRWVQLNVLRSPNAEEQTSITFYNFDRTISNWYHTPGEICLDGTRSSTLPEVWVRPPERAVFERGSEPLSLRVLIDRSVVEVFVNKKLYLAMRVYPGREDSVGVSIRAQGQDAVLKQLDAWEMNDIWTSDKKSD